MASKQAPTISATDIALVRAAFERNLGDFPRRCTCLRETFAEFTDDIVLTPADAAACFPEMLPHTVRWEYLRAMKIWAAL